MLNYDSGGEAPEKYCCDICEKEAGGTLREELSILNFFRKNKRRFTQNEAAGVLAGSETIRWSQEEANQVIGYLLKAKKLRRLKFPWKNKITVE